MTHFLFYIIFYCSYICEKSFIFIATVWLCLFVLTCYYNPNVGSFSLAWQQIMFKSSLSFKCSFTYSRPETSDFEIDYRESSFVQLFVHLDKISGSDTILIDRVSLYF